MTELYEELLARADGGDWAARLALSLWIALRDTARSLLAQQLEEEAKAHQATKLGYDLAATVHEVRAQTLREALGRLDYWVSHRAPEVAADLRGATASTPWRP